MLLKTKSAFTRPIVTSTGPAEPGQRGYVGVMPDEPAFDVISGGRDPDHRRAPWRLLAGVAAAVLIAGGIAFHLISGPSGSVPPRKPQASPSSVALAAPSMLHGTPVRPGGAPGTLLFLGGEELRLLTVREQAPTSLASVLPDAGDARNPLGPDPAVQQIISVAGGVVALIYSHGSADLPDIGDVLFVPVDARGAGPPAHHRPGELHGASAEPSRCLGRAGWAAVGQRAGRQPGLACR